MVRHLLFLVKNKVIVMENLQKNTWPCQWLKA